VNYAGQDLLLTVINAGGWLELAERLQQTGTAPVAQT
jgi:hypothetical protein